MNEIILNCLMTIIGGILGIGLVYLIKWIALRQGERKDE